MDLELLWLWPVPVPATLIQPLAWRLPYAMGAALEKGKKTKKKKKKNNKIMPFAATLMQLEIIILSKSDREKQIHLLEFPSWRSG